MLRNHTLTEDISDSLTEITKHLLERNYLRVSWNIYRPDLFVKVEANIINKNNNKMFSSLG